MKKQKTKLQADGQELRERWYALARRYCTIIAKRERNRARCARCFKMKFDKGKGKTFPRFGCDGCTEMDCFFNECKAFFEGVKIGQEWRII